MKHDDGWRTVNGGAAHVWERPQTGRKQVTDDGQGVVRGRSQTGRKPVVWRAIRAVIRWVARGCVFVCRETKRFGVELVAPVVAVLVWTAAGAYSTDGAIWFLGIGSGRVNAGSGEVGLVGAGVVWRRYAVGGWLFLPLFLAALGCWVAAVTLVERNPPEMRGPVGRLLRVHPQRFAMVAFVLSVAVGSFVASTVGVNRGPVWLRVLVLTVPVVASWLWVIHSPVADTAKGFRLRVRRHRVVRHWGARLQRVVAHAGGVVPLKVVAAKETLHAATILVRVPPLNGVTAREVADMVGAYGALVFGRVRWADGMISTVGDAAVSAVVSKDDAGLVTVTVRRADPLATTITYPADRVTRQSINVGVLFGHDTNGRTITLPVLNQHGLLAGLPGSGKSVGLGLVMRAVVDAPDAALWSIDLKRGVELGRWLAHTNKAALDHDQCAVLLSELEHEMNGRLDRMRSEGRTMWAPSPTDPLIVLTVDEMAELSADETVTLTRIIRLGRAAGISVWGAVQKPTGDVIPTALRDLMGVRVCFRVASKQTTGVVLGTSGDDAPDASMLSGPGMCWVASDNGLMRARAFMLGADQIPEAGRGIERVRVPLDGNALTVWGALSASPNGLTVAELSDGCGIDRGLVGRVLKGLVSRGAVVRGPGRPAVYRAVDIDPN